ncbi:MAG TPA: hypothetical protein VM305_02860 [Candidatus Limnocylindrales bacterium]|nr:hypothetical protein [Candidatus Limnocylindrales bacterium]
MKPRFLSALALSVLLVLSLAGCDEQGRTEPGTPAPITESPLEVTEPPPAAP